MKHICEKCKSSVDLTDNFCGNCGAEFIFDSKMAELGLIVKESKDADEFVKNIHKLMPRVAKRIKDPELKKWYKTLSDEFAENEVIYFGGIGKVAVQKTPFKKLQVKLDKELEGILSEMFNAYKKKNNLPKDEDPLNFYETDLDDAGSFVIFSTVKLSEKEVYKKIGIVDAYREVKPPFKLGKNTYNVYVGVVNV